jgi:AbrB family looped-hinge helix DNA binding protein
MKVTTEGQVTIPVRVREYLRISPHSEVDFRIADDQVVLVKSTPSEQTKNRFQKMRGVLKGKMTTDQWMQDTREL